MFWWLFAAVVVVVDVVDVVVVFGEGLRSHSSGSDKRREAAHAAIVQPF